MFIPAQTAWYLQKFAIAALVLLWFERVIEVVPRWLDVLANYTPVHSYYRLVKTVETDPEFDVKRAQKKLRRYVEGHKHAIRLKAEIMVDHFHQQVLSAGKIGGKARAMVVTSASITAPSGSTT